MSTSRGCRPPRCAPTRRRAKPAPRSGSASTPRAHANTPAPAPLNARLDQTATARHCRLAPADQALLERAIESLHLSARAMHRILRVARTIADLDDSADIASKHLTEALGYRGVDAAQAPTA